MVFPFHGMKGGFRRVLPLRGDKVPMGSLKNGWPFHGSFFIKTGKPDLSGWTECGRKARKARIKFLSHVALPLGKTVKGQKTPWFGPKTAAWERKFDLPLFFPGQRAERTDSRENTPKRERHSVFLL